MPYPHSKVVHHLIDDAFAGSVTYATAYVLASAIKKIVM
jgi:electron transfer flavoprotein alpha/beta subunit